MLGSNAERESNLVIFLPIFLLMFTLFLLEHNTSLLRWILHFSSFAVTW